MIDIFYILKYMTKEEWNSKSLDWRRGWEAGQFGEDMNMNKKEIENMSKDWRDGLKFALTHPAGGAVPM